MVIKASPESRHIVSLSGGKDSTALAIYLRDRISGLEYVFCDTGEELPETYEYLSRLEVYLGRPIKRLRYRFSFAELLQSRNGFLPSVQARWCTEYLKLKPFEQEIGSDMCHTYIGIRADEAQRKGYISTKPNIVAQYPFVEDGIMKADVLEMLQGTGLGLPKYYDWRSRSGCYFCFFQQRIEWVGLMEAHPDLFEKAMKYERVVPETGERYTWAARESLSELMQPERVAQIKAEQLARLRQTGRRSNLPLAQVLAEENPHRGCIICHL